MIRQYKAATSTTITPVLRLQIERVIGDFREGVHRSVMAGNGADFRGIREYDFGDPPSRIDWFASARMSDDDETLVTREYHPERSINVLYAMDAGASMAYPERKREYGELFQLLFARSTFRSRDRFRLVFFDESSVASTEWGQDGRWLSEAFFEEASTGLVPYLNGLGLTNTLLVLVSDCNGKGGMTAEHIRELSALDVWNRNVRVVLLVLDEWAGFRPIGFRAAFLDVFEKRERQLDLRPRKTAEREVNEHKKHIRELKRAARPLGALCITVPLITDDPLRIIRATFLKSGFE